MFGRKDNRGHNVQKGKQGFQPVRLTPLEAPTSGPGLKAADLAGGVSSVKSDDRFAAASDKFKKRGAINLYTRDSVDPIKCRKKDWTKCEQHKGLSPVPPSLKSVADVFQNTNITIVDTESLPDNIVTSVEYYNGITRDKNNPIKMDLIPSGSNSPVTIEVYDFDNKFAPTEKEGKIFIRLDSHEARFMDMDEKQFTFSQIAFNGDYKMGDKKIVTYKTYGNADGYNIYEVSYEDYS